MKLVKIPVTLAEEKKAIELEVGKAAPAEMAKAAASLLGRNYKALTEPYKGKTIPVSFFIETVGQVYGRMFVNTEGKVKLVSFAGQTV